MAFDKSRPMSEVHSVATRLAFLGHHGSFRDRRYDLSGSSECQNAGQSSLSAPLEKQSRPFGAKLALSGRRNSFNDHTRHVLGPDETRSSRSDAAAGFDVDDNSSQAEVERSKPQHQGQQSSAFQSRLEHYPGGKRAGRRKFPEARIRTVQSIKSTQSHWDRRPHASVDGAGELDDNPNPSRPDHRAHEYADSRQEVDIRALHGIRNDSTCGDCTKLKVKCVFPGRDSKYGQGGHICMDDGVEFRPQRTSRMEKPPNRSGSGPVASRLDLETAQSPYKGRLYPEMHNQQAVVRKASNAQTEHSKINNDIKLTVAPVYTGEQAKVDLDQALDQAIAKRDQDHDRPRACAEHPAKGMFMHYTISEDRSGDQEAVKAAILSRLGEKSSANPFQTRSESGETALDHDLQEVEKDQGIEPTRIPSTGLRLPYPSPQEVWARTVLTGEQQHRIRMAVQEQKHTQEWHARVDIRTRVVAVESVLWTIVDFEGMPLEKSTMDKFVTDALDHEALSFSVLLAKKTYLKEMGVLQHYGRSRPQNGSMNDFKRQFSGSPMTHGHGLSK